MTADFNSSHTSSDIAQGILDGYKAIVSDEKLVKEFWKKGWEELASHTSTNASQWIGKRVLTWIITAITVAGFAWLVKSGAVS